MEEIVGVVDIVAGGIDKTLFAVQERLHVADICHSDTVSDDRIGGDLIQYLLEQVLPIEEFRPRIGEDRVRGAGSDQQKFRGRISLPHLLHNAADIIRKCFQISAAVVHTEGDDHEVGVMYAHALFGAFVTPDGILTTYRGIVEGDITAEMCPQSLDKQGGIRRLKGLCVAVFAGVGARRNTVTI